MSMIPQKTSPDPYLLHKHDNNSWMKNETADNQIINKALHARASREPLEEAAIKAITRDHINKVININRALNINKATNNASRSITAGVLLHLHQANIALWRFLGALAYGTEFGCCFLYFPSTLRTLGTAMLH